MNYAIGKWFQRKSSRIFRTDGKLTWQEAAVLLGVGVTIVAFHAVFRWPLNMPGRHGIEWMALLVIARAKSQNRWAASISGVGAAATSLLPLWGFGDPFISLVYLVPGIVMDLMYRAGGRWQRNIVFLGLAGGLAHATKPLIRFMITLISGLPYGSLISGLAYPLLTHMIFGILGGLFGATLLLKANRHK